MPPTQRSQKSLKAQNRPILLLLLSANLIVFAVLLTTGVLAVPGAATPGR